MVFTLGHGVSPSVTNATKLKVVPIYDKNTQPIHNLHTAFAFLYSSYSIALKTSR